MKIILTRSGGFTGIALKKTIDTSQLPSEKAKEIEDLVTQSQFFTLPGTIQNPAGPGIKPYPASPDRFTYGISIEHDTLTHSLTISEETLTPAIKNLIDCLRKI